MRVGVPTEVKNSEFRVAVTPAGVHALVGRGHEVLVQAGAGVGSGIPDSDFVGAGARVVGDVESVWGDADLVLKVKEPVAEEYGRLHEGLVLFTYLHLAADEALTRELLGRGVTSIAYETVELADHSLPLLSPMSEIAGRLAAQVGANCLLQSAGGRGVLFGGGSGVRRGRVSVLGGGVGGRGSGARGRRSVRLPSWGRLPGLQGSRRGGAPAAMRGAGAGGGRTGWSCS